MRGCLVLGIEVTFPTGRQLSRPKRYRSFEDLDLAPMRIHQNLPPRCLDLARQGTLGQLTAWYVLAQPGGAPRGIGLPALCRLAARIDIDGSAHGGHAIDLIVDERMGVDVMLGVAPRLPHSRRANRRSRCALRGVGAAHRTSDR